MKVIITDDAQTVYFNICNTEAILRLIHPQIMTSSFAVINNIEEGILCLVSELEDLKAKLEPLNDAIQFAPYEIDFQIVHIARAAFEPVRDNIHLRVIDHTSSTKYHNTEQDKLLCHAVFGIHDLICHANELFERMLQNSNKIAA